MSKLAVKAQNILQKIGERSGLTKSGGDWMRMALDPFPDNVVECVGYPDTVKTPSVIQPWKQKIVVSAPAGVSGNWDCNIFHPGILNEQFYYQPTFTDAYAIQAYNSQTQYGSGPIEVRAAAAGQNLTQATSVQHIAPLPDLTAPIRLTAIGFEVINDTAPLNKQGSVVYWKQPAVVQGDSTAMYFTTGGYTVKPTAIPYVGINDAPNTVSGALVMAGSLERAAAEGAYCVPQLNDPINPPKGGNATKAALVFPFEGGPNLYSTLVQPGTATQVVATDTVLSGFDQVGAYFTGLSPTTELSVILHYVTERFPTRATSMDLVTVAKSSMPYDPIAIEMYTRIASEMPPGTEQKNNSLGAWISAAAEIGKTLIPHLAKGVSNWLNPKEEQYVAKINKEVQMANLRKIRADITPETANFEEYLKYVKPRHRDNPSRERVEVVRVVEQPVHRMPKPLPPIPKPKLPPKQATVMTHESKREKQKK